jgi:hypothetical protein
MNMVICKISFNNNNNNNYNFFSISNASDRTMIASSTIRKCFAEIIQDRNGAHEMVGSQELVPKRWCSIQNCSPPSTESKKRATIHAT